MNAENSHAASAETYELIAVRHGTLLTRRSHMYLNYDVYDEADDEMRIDYFFWVARSAERLVLIDTGFSVDAARRRGREVLVPVPEALELLGLDTSAPVDVVLTHLHYDHVGNVAALPNATFHIARAEYDFWMSERSRTTNFRSVVENDEIAAVAEAHAAGRVSFIDQTAQIAPSIVALAMPGHTPGQLVVTVATGRGVVVLASDATHFDEELERDMPFRQTADLVGLHEGLDLLRTWRATGTVADIVAGHEPSVMSRYPALSGALAKHAVVIASS